MENEEINLPAGVPQSVEIEKEGILFWVKFLALFGVIFAAPFFFNQGLSGSMVNAVLFIATVILGVRTASLLALMPSLVSLAIGFLPFVLFPVVPFIMASNIILIYIFDYLRRKNYWLAMISASFLKFIFLYLTSSVVIKFVIAKQLAGALSLMMSWPQLVTAIFGGVIAYFFLKSIRKI